MEVRIALQSDYSGLVRLCRRAVGPGDYVIRYLRDAIGKRGVFMAFEEGRLVGMSDFRRCVDGSGWLGMARTDPDWRRRGVALFLQRSIATHARKKGIRTLRMWVRGSNGPALKAAEKGGFRQACEAVHVSHLFRPRKEQGRLMRVKTVDGKLAKSILESNYLTRMNGCLGYGWHFVKPDRNVLGRLARSGELFQTDQTVFLLSKQDYAATDGEGPRRIREFSILLGPAKESISRVKDSARAMGLSLVGSYLPRDARLLRMARAEGFRVDSWGDRCIVFEKKLRP
jgi:GNAT superfamily N-acetyltransferase